MVLEELLQLALPYEEPSEGLELLHRVRPLLQLVGQLHHLGVVEVVVVVEVVEVVIDHTFFQLPSSLAFSISVSSPPPGRFL